MIREESILICLAKIGPAKATEVAKYCGFESRKAANSALYALQTAGKAMISADYHWSLRVTKKAVAQASLLGSSRAKKQPPTTVPALPPHSARSISPISNSTTEKTVSDNNGSTGEIIWTSEQEIIINASPGTRVLVEAGPGTGKTAVACARVAKLLRDDNITPSSILMVSFTRTAVSEMKNRIRQWADSGRVNAVNICTLDQAAFQFGIGCGEKFKRLMGNFDDNIQATLQHFAKEDALLLEYIRGLEHVIIDEAQDLIGHRAKLASNLLTSLRSDAGATVFADGAQAIFGFPANAKIPRSGKENFLQSFDPDAAGFKKSQLKKIHRSADPKILELFTNSRWVLHEPASGYDSHVREVIKSACDSAPCEGDEVNQLPLMDGDLLLYRKRVSALMHAMWCPRLFRLRLPAHPTALYSWVGLVFSGYTEPLVSRAKFTAAWKERVSAEMADGFSPDTAWALLYRFAADRGDVSLTRLRAKLSLPRPPVEFCQLDYGHAGPIFSTIHASKGREADRVFLMLPRNLNYLEDNENIDPEEEARVFYVGSTRVRKHFFRGIAPTLKYATRLEKGSERVIQVCAENKLKIQIGLSRDFDDLAPISRDPFFCGSAAAAVEHQTIIVERWRKCLADQTAATIKAIVKPQMGADVWPFQFVDESERQLAWSAPFFGQDLRTMCKQVQEKFGGKRRPAGSISHLRMIGLRTCVLGDNPAALGRLHKPFANSGFWLTPMIVGFQPVSFPLRNNTQ